MCVNLPCLCMFVNDSHMCRWRKKFLVALTGLVHTMLGPNRLRSHIVLMTVAYHRDDRPGFEVSPV